MGVFGPVPHDGIGYAESMSAAMSCSSMASPLRIGPGIRERLWLGYTETRGRAGSTNGDRRRPTRPSTPTTFSASRGRKRACLRGECGCSCSTPTDHAIVIVPNYQAAETDSARAFAQVTGVPLIEEDGWQLDVDALRAAPFDPNTKLVSINFPNNPTGAIPSREVTSIRLDRPVSGSTMACICSATRSHRRAGGRRGNKRLPQVADVYERGLSLNVMSKAYGLPGLRIGWIASQDPGLLNRLERYKHYLSICNSAPSERLACIALKAQDRILERNRRLIRDNLVRLNAFFSAYPNLFEWRPPDGGCVAFPRYLGSDGVEAFCTRLVEQAGILLLPASLYRSELLSTPVDRFRIGCGRRNIEAGLAAFRQAL